MPKMFTCQDASHPSHLCRVEKQFLDINNLESAEWRQAAIKRKKKRLAAIVSDLDRARQEAYLSQFSETTPFEREESSSIVPKPPLAIVLDTGEGVFFRAEYKGADVGVKAIAVLPRSFDGAEPGLMGGNVAMPQTWQMLLFEYQALQALYDEDTALVARPYTTFITKNWDHIKLPEAILKPLTDAGTTWVASVTEFGDGGTVHDSLYQGLWGESLAEQLWIGMITVLAGIARKGMLTWDLKPDNFVIRTAADNKRSAIPGVGQVLAIDIARPYSLSVDETSQLGLSELEIATLMKQILALHSYGYNRKRVQYYLSRGDGKDHSKQIKKHTWFRDFFWDKVERIYLANLEQRNTFQRVLGIVDQFVTKHQKKYPSHKLTSPTYTLVDKMFSVSTWEHLDEMDDVESILVFLFHEDPHTAEFQEWIKARNNRGALA